MSKRVQANFFQKHENNHNRPFPTDRDRCILSVEVTYTNMISLVEEQVHFLPNRWQKLELELKLFTILVIQLKIKHQY